MAPSSRPIKDLPSIGAERALKVISGRWKLVILWTLFDGPLRLRDLEAAIPSASQKVILGQLRELEEHGLVVREHGGGVRYDATDVARTLRPLILDLCAWGSRHEREARGRTR